MIDISPTTIEVLQEHETATQSDVRLVQMSLGGLCPLREIEPFRAALQDFDSRRLFVAGDLVDVTRSGSGLFDEISLMLGLEVAMEYTDGDAMIDLDLTTADWLEPILVTNCMDAGALTVIGGSHHMFLHLFNHGTLDGVRVFVVQHQNVNQWLHGFEMENRWFRLGDLGLYPD